MSDKPLSSPAITPPPKLLDQVRERIRLKHYSLCTEQAYLHWVKRYIISHGKRHPKDSDEKRRVRYFPVPAFRALTTSSAARAPF
jgi:hypothetical protein